MSAHADQRMVEEFMAGTQVPDIAARYAVPEDYVDRVIEEASFVKPKADPWSFVKPRVDRWSMKHWENRAAYSIAAGIVAGLAIHVEAVGTAVAVALFVITTAIVTAGRR